MNWITRYIENNFDDFIVPGKVFVLFGARRVGKSSVLQKYIRTRVDNCFIGSGDDIQVRKILSSEDMISITNSFRGYNAILIDEAQRIPNIGWGLKLLVDTNPNLKIIVSGSSSFKLSSQTGEPLTGRQNVFNMFPISMMEIADTKGRMEIVQNLNNYLIYGTYPETLNAINYQQKQKYLFALRNSYLFKDILELDNIKSHDKLHDLLQLLAYQIGNEVSLSELAGALGIAKQTVERYLDLLEKSFIIIKIRGYSSNLRTEITKTHRYYFWDNGVRNAVINNFNEISQRNDIGMLWENFCVIERLKKQQYHQIFSNNYFWRTYDRQEIDLVEDRDGKLYGYEFKWNPKKRTKSPKLFTENYPDSSFVCITQDNFMDFIL